MGKAGLVFGLVMVLAGCSTTHTPRSERAEFRGGAISISYSKDGEFQSLRSKATAKVTSNLPSALDEAITVATLRARRQIVEFLKIEIESDQFIKVLTNSSQKSDQANSVRDLSTVRSDIGYSVREDLRQKSKGFVQGSYIVSEEFDPENKLVSVTVGFGTAERGALTALKNYVK
jgi:hypothetical protein